VWVVRGVGRWGCQITFDLLLVGQLSPCWPLCVIAALPYAYGHIPFHSIAVTAAGAAG
jgi:hypothetical protein